VAFHPLCHLDVHEERGLEWLHGLHAALLGHRDRLVTTKDVEELKEPVAAVLLELPQRDLGGRLPEWDELVATVEAARAGGAAVHLDGARLWQCGPFYDRELAEIAALFDTVYVSFYKDLRAPAGCILAGAPDVVDEARVWQVRHGGRLFTAFPYLLAAEAGLDEVLPRMPAYVEHARALASALAELDGVSVVPDPPQVSMFHLHVRRDPERLEEASVELAAETKTWLASGWRPGADPAVAIAELSLGESNLGVEPREAAELYAELLRRSA
jgi:threonine aldolase